LYLFTAASSTALILVGLSAAFVFNMSLAGSTGSQEEFNSDEFWLGFTKNQKTQWFVLA